MRIAVARGVHPVDPYARAFAAAMRIPRGASVLDLGCGAGVYALLAAARGAGRVVATDVDAAAVACARANALRNRLAQVEVRRGSLFEPVRGERFDVIVSAPPQLPAPRRISLTRFGGPDGLRFFRKLAAGAGRHLAPGGRIYLVVTSWVDPARVAALLETRGFRVREIASVERAFRPVEYERQAPGLFRYLDARARAGRGAYRRAGPRCYLRIYLLEATYRPVQRSARATSPCSRRSPPRKSR